MVSDPFGQAPRYRRSGERFNAWTLIERVPNRGWLCRCDCGKELVRWLSSITSGRSRTCGDYSLKQEHYAPRCRPCHKIRDIRLKRPA